MPITFPAHAAAILPLRKISSLPTTALVVGSVAPDFGFISRGGTAGSHSLWGLLWFCVPAGLLAFVCLEALILPALQKAISPAWVHVSGLPSSARSWAFVALGLIVGAITHLVLDGFTHEWMWPASALWAGHTVPFLGGDAAVTHALHVILSVAGSVLVVGVCAVRAFAVRARAVVAWRPLSVLSVSMVLGALVAATVGAHVANFGSLFEPGWLVVCGAWIGLLLGSVVVLQMASPRCR